MSENRTGGEIDGIVAELQAFTAKVRAAFGRLSATQLNWKPSAEQWSVGQCFDHLINTNRCFFPDMERVASRKHRNSFWARISPLSGFTGRLIVSSLDPEKGRKIKSPRAFLPTSSDVDAEVIERFAQHQMEVATLMRATEGADLRRTMVASPVTALATYSLLDAYRIVIAHERKHFAQARKVMEAEGFPSS